MRELCPLLARPRRLKCVLFNCASKFRALEPQYRGGFRGQIPRHNKIAGKGSVFIVWKWIRSGYDSHGMNWLSSALGLGVRGPSGQDAVVGADPEGRGLHHAPKPAHPDPLLEPEVPCIPRVHESLMAVFGRVPEQPLQRFRTQRASGVPQSHLPSCTLSRALSDCQEPRLHSAPRSDSD